MPENRSGNGNRSSGGTTALERTTRTTLSSAAKTRGDAAKEPGAASPIPPLPRTPRGTIESRQRVDAESILSNLVGLHRDSVYRYCRRMLNQDADASDVSQMVFMQAFEALCKGVDVQNERAWLLGIARNRCVDRLRRPGPELLDQEGLERVVDRDPGGDLVTSDSAARRALEDCLDALEPRSRAVLLLRFHDDLSYQEISALTGDSPGALRVRVARALPVLRGCLEKKGFVL